MAWELTPLLKASKSYIDSHQILSNVRIHEHISFSEVVTRHTQHGNLKNAVRIYLQNPEFDSFCLLLSLLKGCAMVRDLVIGRELHDYIICSGFEHDLYIGSSLVDFYVKCTSILDARNVFNKMPNRNVVSWNALLAGYVDNELNENIVCLFHQMQLEGVTPDVITYVNLLKAFQFMKDINMGRELHNKIVMSGLEHDMFVGSSIVSMYTKSGLLSDAWDVFKKLAMRDAVLWTALISGFAEHGGCKEALKHIETMKHDNLTPTAHLYACILKCCSTLKMADKGREIHIEVTIKGFEADLYVGTSLVDMYAKCLSLIEACEVLDKMSVSTVASWNALITGYADHGQGDKLLECYRNMQAEKVAPDNTTFTCGLKSCASIGAIKEGQELHKEVIHRGLEEDLLIGTALVDMYANFGLLAEAQKVFDKMTVRNIVVWNALIAGYVEQESNQQAMECLEGMKLQEISPNATTFTCILECCNSVGRLENDAREIHSLVVMQGYEQDSFVGNMLVNLYAKRGALWEAKQVFDTLQVKSSETWTSLITGYVEQDKSMEALNCFEHMKLGGIFLDAVLFVCVLKACGCSKDVEKCLEVHQEILRKGLERDPFVSITLVDVYCKCNCLPEAHLVFLTLPDKTTVAWNALIGGYAEHGPSHVALSLYADMQIQGTSPSIVTYISALRASGQIGAIEEGRKIHKELRQRGVEEDPFVISTLIDMYAECGSLHEAWGAFNKLPHGDVVPSWNAMLKACGINNEGDMAIHLFEKMQEMSVKPDGITFTCLLTACCRSSLVIEGQNFFKGMKMYGIDPTVEHLACMVDILARSGHLSQAEKLFESLPHIPSKQMWTVLLSACNIYAELELGERCFEHLRSLDRASCTDDYVSVETPRNHA